MRSDLVDHCLELLAPLGAVRARRMFGGHGLYCDDLFFALIASDRLYLKADAQSQPAFEGAGCEPFVYEARGRSLQRATGQCRPRRWSRPLRCSPGRGWPWPRRCGPGPPNPRPRHARRARCRPRPRPEPRGADGESAARRAAASPTPQACRGARPGPRGRRRGHTASRSPGGSTWSSGSPLRVTHSVPSRATSQAGCGASQRCTSRINTCSMANSCLYPIRE